MHKPEDARACLEQAHETLDNLASDVPKPPMAYEEIAAEYARAGEHDLSVNYYKKSLKAYDKVGELENKAQCYWRLGMEHLNAQEYDDARQSFEEGSQLLDYCKRSTAAGVCRAALELLDDVGESNIPSLLNWSAACMPVHVKNGIYRESEAHHGGFSHWASKEPAALQIWAVLSQLTRCGKFLDKKMPVGKNWCDKIEPARMRSLDTKISVLSNSEIVGIPAGVFENCLLVEYIIEDNGQPDNISKEIIDFYRVAYLGKRLAWFAVGVGLVKLQVNTASGIEAIFELTDFSLEQSGSDYLPLYIGNTWTYKWANISDEYVAVEKWKAIAHKDSTWFLEHYHFAYKQ